MGRETAAHLPRSRGCFPPSGPQLRRRGTSPSCFSHHAGALTWRQAN